MTATTAIPLAVLTGLAFKRGSSLVLYSSGMDEMMSVSLGAKFNLFSLAISCFTLEMFIFSFLS